MDAPDVTGMTVAEKRKLLVDYWTKKPPVESPVAGKGGGADKKAAVPAAGPGTEQELLLAELGYDADEINEVCKAGCADYAAMMDGWGVEGCKRRLNEIAGRLKDQAILQKARFRDGPVKWMGVAARALKIGLILNPTNPYPGLVAECIRRAEAKAAARPVVGEAGREA